MSDRAKAQMRLVRYLTEDRRWSAPYGVEPGLKRLPRGGAVRTILFGVARWLDGMVYVWSPTRIVIEGEGALADRVAGEFGSVGEAIAHLRRVADDA